MPTIEELTARLEKAKVVFREQAAKEKALTVENEELKTKVAELSNKPAPDYDRDALTKEIETLRAENTLYEGRLKQAAFDIEAKDASIVTLNADVKKAQEDVQKANEATTIITEQFHTLEERLNAVLIENDELKKLEDKVSQVDSLSQRCMEITALLEERTKMLTISESTVRELEHHIKKLETQKKSGEEKFKTRVEQVKKEINKSLNDGLGSEFNLF